MQKKDIAIALFGIALVAAVVLLWLSPGGAQPAPVATFTTLEGRSFQLTDLMGRPVLVVFWATTCPGCVKEMPHLVELYRELHGKGLEIVGVSMEYDPVDQVQELVRQRDIPYLIAPDRDGAIAHAFGDVALTPTSFLIDPQGKIAQHKLGELDMNLLRSRLATMLPEAG